MREGLSALQCFPNHPVAPGRARLKIAVTPTFARCMLIPRLAQFTEAYPEIDIALQVAIPLLDVVAEDADLMVRYGMGHYADVEHMEIARDVYTPLASPASCAAMARSSTLKTCAICRCCAARWSPGGHGSRLQGWTGQSPPEGSQFNDIGLLCDAAAAGLGVAPVRLKLGAPWLDNGALVRLFDLNAPAPTPTICAGAPAPWTAGNARPLQSGWPRPCSGAAGKC